MSEKKLCATCTPINPTNQTKTKYKIVVETPNENYKIEAKNSFDVFAVFIVFAGLFYLFFFPKKKKNAWDAKKYRNQPYINVSSISDDDGVVGLFGQRFSQKPTEKYCLPPPKIQNV